ncbi:DNA polymerase zeta [Xanthoria parietina]
MDIFRVRLNCVDHYQGLPTKFDPRLPGRLDQSKQKDASKVPVIRVFGATEAGQKVCAHIHGAFPYLYVEYHGSLIPDDVDAYIHRLHLSIDHALAVSYRRNMYDGKTAFVAHISLVKGVPFYGYNVGYKFFLKVYMLNPLHMTRLADLLRQGAVMKKVLQPYESHMQYLLQWMCDYNLYGCAYIDCSEVKFRAPVPEYDRLDNVTHNWHDRTITRSMTSDEQTLPRQSHCSLEVDVCVHHILNRLDIKPRPLHHDFVERQQSFAHDEKLVHSMAGLWRDETRRRKALMGESNPDSSPFPPEVLVSVSADPRNSQPGGWIHEAEYRAKIDDLTKDERDKSDGRRLAFDSFVKKTPFEGFVKSSLEAVEDLFPENIAKLSASQKASQSKNPEDIPVFDEADVDVSRASFFKDDDFQYESDEEIAREMELSQRRQGDLVDERLADDGIGESEQADEPLSNEHTNHNESILPPTLGKPRGPISSAELANMGIRNVANEGHPQEDDFEIPIEYACDITAAKKRHDKLKRPLSKSEFPNKARKFSHEGGPDSRDTADNQSTNQEADGSSRPDLPYTHDLPQHGRNEYRCTEASQAGRDFDVSVQPLRSFHTLAPASQQISFGGSQGNRTLSFPIVKDPQNPDTIRRLSQLSNSPIKTHTEDSLAIKRPSLNQPNKELSSVLMESPEATPKVVAASSQVLMLSSLLHQGFNITPEKKIHCIAYAPPSASESSSELNAMKKPSIIYQDAYYSDKNDVPERAREYAGKDFKIASDTVAYLPDFDPTGTSSATYGEKHAVLVDKLAEERHYRTTSHKCGLRSWQIAKPPPTHFEVQEWLRQENHVEEAAVPIIATEPGSKHDVSQIEAATQKNQHGFKYSQKQKTTSVQQETQYMSMMSLELHVNTRSNLVPNPEQDEISCIFWCIRSDDDNLEVNGANEGTHVGIVALSGERGLAQKIAHHSSVEVEEEELELDLINRMVDIVRSYDPDILTGYEVHGGSWGYLIERGRCQYDFDLCDEFSRMKSQSHGRFGKESDRWGFNHTSTIRVTGRHMINIWRAMRGELNLLQYTMENVVFHLLHRRVPHYPYQDLTKWYTSDKPKDLARVVDYYVSRVQLDLEILEQNELVPRTSEQARLLGVDFFSVFSRGSQFKVESLMFRIAKPENFLLPSPSRKQVGQQNALECLPLVMEPQSAFYNSPLLVLDFQSLYPSVMIAYNYCYSTFLGRVVSWRGQNKMGFTDYQRDPRLLELFKDRVNIAPNGMMYVKPDMRKSLLAKMLGEILETRVMVKSGMKVDKNDKTLQRLLNNRQLALKLIANVTYGYTSASFSGRMPCSEIADSIVQTGRETLEKAIALIHSVEKWGAEVVYGDTDSLFVYLKGRSKDEAFDIGEEIAKTITKMNPRPIKLKFEKVYFPCVLLAKKRYVGFKYESKEQEEPDFDAKGIETVRRDGTPAEQKIEEKALKILFRTSDLSQVKKYFQRQCSKIMKGKISIQDFCFAKEVKLGTYSDKGPPPPGALISTKRMLEDPRAEPQYGERVPYVVISGGPGARLIDRCVAPDVLLHNDHHELDAEYYISKNLIPPLERIFNLVGANVRQWYEEMPKFQRIRRIDTESIRKNKELILSKKTLESYMKSSACVVCREKLEDESPICNRCMRQAHLSLLTLRFRQNRAEQKAINLEKVCRSCAGLAWGHDVRCDSKDCQVFYTRARHMTNLKTDTTVMGPVMKVLEAAEEGNLEW